MKVNISQNIIHLLEKAGRVSLPDLGSFTLDRDASTLGHNRKVIYPPTYKLSYSQVTKDINALVKEISLREKISEKMASKVLFQYADKIKKDLSVDGSALIHQMGVLTRKDDNLTFEQAENTVFSRITYALPEVKLSPIISEKKEKKELIEKLQESTNITPKIEDRKLIERSPIVNSKNDSFNWSTVKDWLLALLFAGLIICIYKTCSPQHSVTAVVQHEIDSLNIVKEELLASIDTVTNAQLEKLEDETEVVKCIIITGSFKSARNAIKMKDKITSKGYQSFMKRHGEYNRVGIEFECKGLDLEAYIYKVRSEFDIQAWYLEPKLVVPR